MCNNVEVSEDDSEALENSWSGNLTGRQTNDQHSIKKESYTPRELIEQQTSSQDTIENGAPFTKDRKTVAWPATRCTLNPVAEELTRSREISRGGAERHTMRQPPRLLRSNGERRHMRFCVGSVDLWSWKSVEVWLLRHGKRRLDSGVLRPA